MKTNFQTIFRDQLEQNLVHKVMQFILFILTNQNDFFRATAIYNWKTQYSIHSSTNPGHL